MGKKREYLIARERAKGEEGRPSTKTAFARDFRFNQLFRVGSLLTLRLTLRSPLTSKGRTPIYLKISSSGIWEIVRRGREVLCQSYVGDRRIDGGLRESFDNLQFLLIRFKNSS